MTNIDVCLIKKRRRREKRKIKMEAKSAKTRLGLAASRRDGDGLYYHSPGTRCHFSPAALLHRLVSIEFHFNMLMM